MSVNNITSKSSLSFLSLKCYLVEQKLAKTNIGKTLCWGKAPTSPLCAGILKTNGKLFIPLSVQNILGLTQSKTMFQPGGCCHKNVNCSWVQIQQLSARGSATDPVINMKTFIVVTNLCCKKLFTDGILITCGCLQFDFILVFVFKKKHFS